MATTRSSASSRREPRTAENGSNTKPQEVRIPAGRRLSEDQLRELQALANRPDDEIDYSDIPPLDDEFWKRAVRNPFYRPLKSQLTVRVDNDVLAWLRAKGKGYQTRINAILRRAMLEETSERRSR
jgi:uncharacterized protein (DUF4415 family)